jgi:hypothetical protein
MPEDYTEMDEWTSEEIAQFKENARLQQFDPTSTLAALAAGTVPLTIVAEGDSWFDYLPGTDIIDCLRWYHGHRIYNYAKAGDTLENMIYGTEITRDFQRVSPTIDIVLNRLAQLKPKVFLFSGGGNDVAGDEFESFLNHADSGLPALRIPYVDTMVHVIFRKYFEDLLTKVSTVSPATHILVHGYGHTVPTGQGVNLLFFHFAGPWLRPALVRKSILDSLEQQRAVNTLINEYNDLLAALDQAHPNFHYIDLRPEIDPVGDWVNELHLRNSAYARVAQHINQVILSL